MKSESIACEEKSVASLYKDLEVAETYIRQRFNFSWSRVLHNKQVAAINHIISEQQPANILEIAPGPARIATSLSGVRRGMMIEYSEEMLTLARRRLEEAKLDTVWDVRHGNAFHLDQIQPQFDLLYTFRFVRHFKLDDRERLYQGFRSCLNSGGLLVFDVVNEQVRKKIDLKKDNESNDHLNVYDVCYSEKSFKEEMKSFGFEVLYVVPVINHFSIQSWLSYKLDSRVKCLSNTIVNVFEKIPSKNPLEWVAVCRFMA